MTGEEKAANLSQLHLFTNVITFDRLAPEQGKYEKWGIHSVIRCGKNNDGFATARR